MTTNSRGLRAAIWLVLGVIVSTSVIFADEASGKDKASSEVSEPNLRPSAITDAIKLFADGKDAAAAKRLRDSCWSAEGTAEFEAEYLANLAFVAVSLQECGQPEVAEKVARAALAEAEQLGRKAGFEKKERKKDLLRRSAYIHAKVLRDFETASGLLEEVAQLAPDDVEAAQQATRAKDNARLYGKQKKGAK